MVTLLLRKTSAKRLNTAITRRHLDHVEKRALDAGRSRRWKISRGPVADVNGQNPYVYQCSLTLEPKRPEVLYTLDRITKVITDAANRYRWEVVDETAPTLVTAPATQQQRTYAPIRISSDWRRHFGHIFDRENQVEVIMSRIQAAIDSDWTNRFHVALIGEPAGGKTETAKAFRSVLGERAVLELDGTGTTMAGAIKDLASRSELPRVLIIEEIEKADFKQYPWLLAMLDQRAEIRKVNFRSNIHMDCHMLTIATVNNYKIFRGALEGALASRFCEPVFFPRATRSTLQKILERDIAKLDGRDGRIKGNVRWIAPTLDFAAEIGVTDPRFILAICLSGKDGLISGEYQAKLRSTRLPTNFGG